MEDIKSLEKMRDIFKNAYETANEMIEITKKEQAGEDVDNKQFELIGKLTVLMSEMKSM